MSIRSRSRGALIWLLVIALLALIPAVGTAPAGASGSINVFVGYADTLRGASAQFPTPWEGSPGVIYDDGCSPSTDCQFDAGAVRIENGTTTSQIIDDVKVNVDTCTYDMWTFPQTLAPGNDLVLTQTIDGASSGCQSDGSMDTSDVGPGGADWSNNCTPDGIIPTVDVTVDGAGTSSFSDTGQVLNTGGFDRACDGTNESQSWTPIGHPPPACTGAALSLGPANQSALLPNTASVVANFSNSCVPLSNVEVDVAVTSGPNKGLAGSATTDTSGNATFSYSGSIQGTDTVRATVSNPNGVIASKSVVVQWSDGKLSVLVTGDSYSAGNGAGSYVGAAGCWRSLRNYANQFALSAAKASDHKTYVSNSACSGAVTADFFNAKSGRPPMIDSVNSTYDVVFLTIGGNDVFFKDIVKYCLIGATRDVTHCEPNLKRAESLIASGTVEARIRRVLAAIHARTDPRAHIVLLGYPYLESDASYSLRTKDGRTIKVGQRVRSLSDSANKLEKHLVAALDKQFSTTNLIFVPTTGLFKGHELSSIKLNKDRWFIEPFVDSARIPLFYHPNPKGWSAEASLLFKNPQIPKGDV